MKRIDIEFHNFFLISLRVQNLNEIKVNLNNTIIFNKILFLRKLFINNIIHLHFGIILKYSLLNLVYPPLQFYLRLALKDLVY